MRQILKYTHLFRAHRSFLSTSATLLKVKPLLLADIGEGTKDVEIKKWLVNEGDEIEDWADIVEVQSDKSSVSIQSPKGGIIKKIYHDIDDTVLVGSVLCDIDHPGDDGDDDEVVDAGAGGAKAGDSELQPEQIHLNSDVLATPAVRALAEELGVDINTVVGTGKKNRISKSDVRAAASGGSSSAVAGAAAGSGKVLATPVVRKYAKDNDVELSDVVGTGENGRISKEDIDNFLAAASSAPAAAAGSQSEPKKIDISGLPADVTKKLTAFQKAMVKSMNAANQIPHFGYSEEYDLTNLVRVRSELKDYAKQNHGVNLSYMPFIIKAVSLALHEYPMLNASVNSEETEITYHNRHNIGVAVDTPHGLLVPNVKDCQSRSLLEIADELTRLVNDGRDNKLSPYDLQEGTFALSNIGAIGGTYASPVILPPQVAIGALGKIQKLPRFDANGNVIAANIMVGSWSADHRVIEGAQMARFSNRLKHYLENPSAMLMYLK